MFSDSEPVLYKVPGHGDQRRDGCVCGEGEIAHRFSSLSASAGWLRDTFPLSSPPVYLP